MARAEEEFGRPKGCTLLMAAIESARGVQELREICGASPRLFGVALSGGDYTKDLQTTITGTGVELAGARQLMVIAARASISGAEGGCQAEVGSASGMAAAALVHARGGTPQQMAAACGMALQNLMGLVCDPVAGLVEVPCVKRNVIGAVNALSCADMALAGLDVGIPCGEVIDAMGAVGRVMPSALRETGQGGLAATPTGRRIAERH